jgi:hypothetical protein
LELQQKLRILFADELGSYTLIGSGAVTPALSVRKDTDVITDRTVTGVECVIREFPPISTPKAGYDFIQDKKQWQLYLVLWTGGENTLESCRQILIENFPGCMIGPQTTDPKYQGIQAQQSVRIPDYAGARDYLGA